MSELGAGRELDKAVQERIFGGKVWHRVDTDQHIVTRCSPHHELPAFSTDIACAMLVQAEMGKRGYWMSLKSPEFPGDPWKAVFMAPERPSVRASSPEASEAICRAALKAMEQ